MATVLYNVATGKLLGYTLAPNPGPEQIPDPLPTGTATKTVSVDPGHPPMGSASVWDPIALDYSSVAIRDSVLTVTDFMYRFTRPERTAVRKSADPKVIDFYDLSKRALQVNLDSPRVIGGVNYLESSGVLSVGRAAEILA